ncbi:alpha/beta hydrolase [Azospirillum agricola]|uniref:alpha/beta hydrolase n=1 Tax=Azospirillum agricola TaxID=1720247 RepID=UPI000A0F193D|nr:alpha/beta hydrolase-fold protein [Azospirillum agricola]SMH29987.1 hypothetical protein SAMN02982994_0250 [Azospirillum lipoferum]
MMSDPAPTRRRMMAATAAGLSLAGIPARAAPETGMEPATEAAVTLSRTAQWDRLAGGDPARPHRVFVAWPEVEAPPEGFPVLYLLDGNSVFGTAVEAMRVTGARGAAMAPPPAVVVAIGYPTDKPFDLARRARDYTPPAAGAPEGTGGADAFLAFIENELKPEIERRFRIDRARQTLFGHSYGGLCVLHALFTRSGGFQRYVAASPSIWWHGRAVLESERRFTAALPADAATRSLLVTVGEHELVSPSGPAADPAVEERRRAARMVENARELAGRLAALAPRGPAVEFVSFAGETHGSVIPSAVGRAVGVAIRR